MTRNGFGGTRTARRLGGLALGVAMFFAPAMTASAQDHAPPHGHAEAGEGESHGHAHAETLVPGSGAMGRYAPMLYAVLGLFAAAIVVGVARDAAGAKDPGIAASDFDHQHAHHDDHDTHAHDDHGHDASTGKH